MPLLSIAVVEPLPGAEQETLRLMRELNATCARKGYSRDALYRDANEPAVLVNLRYWSSSEARRQAQDDPDLHRYWRELGLICKPRRVYEMLEPIGEISPEAEP